VLLHLLYVGIVQKDPIEAKRCGGIRNHLAVKLIDVGGYTVTPSDWGWIRRSSVISVLI
jgi:hypothetical protein